MLPIGDLRIRGGKHVAALVALALAGAANAVPNGYTPYWSDEFNRGVGLQANPSYWGYNTGATGSGNEELEDYTSSATNSHIVSDPNATDGMALQIEAIKTSSGYTSARLLTQGKVAPQFGFIEARIRMTYGQGIWPAFWMLGSNINTVSWPQCGELDVMENIGSSPNTNWGSFHATSFNASETYALPSPEVYHTGYHLFQASWSPNCITMYVDGVPYHTENINNDPKWPFNEPMFFILNVAVGGNWPGSPNSTTVFPQNMLVDYVRIYHLTAPTSNEVVSFFSSANNKYVSAENAGASALDCSRVAASTWEQFLVVDLGGNQVALQSLANNKFVTVATSGTPALTANASSVTSSAKFQWVPSVTGTVTLKSLANGKYVTVDTTKSPAAVVASSTSAGTPQALGVTCYSQQAAPSAPAVPTHLTATPGSGSIALSWWPVSGATGYEVYRSALPGGGGMVPIAAVSSVDYKDTGLSKSTKYSYCVSAIDAHGMSLRSSPASANPRLILP